jgi:hypothetical protein
MDQPKSPVRWPLAKTARSSPPAWPMPCPAGPTGCAPEFGSEWPGDAVRRGNRRTMEAQTVGRRCWPVGGFSCGNGPLLALFHRHRQESPGTASVGRQLC